MNRNNRRLFLAISAVILLAGAIISELIYFSDYEYHVRTRRFNKILSEKEKVMEECLNDLKLILANGEPHGSLKEKNLFMLAGGNRITILEYIDNKLIHWSDNGFDVPREIHDDSFYAKPIIFIQNGWFIPRTIQAGNEKIVGLLRVRTDYGFENDIIRNGFERDFKLPQDAGFTTVKDSAGYNIYSAGGDFLFSILFPEINSNTPLIIIPILFWSLFFIALVLMILALAKIMADRGMNVPGLLISLALFALLYFALLFTSKPEVIFRTGLFSSYHFSLNELIPSLGHLLLLSILGAVFSFCLYKYLPEEPVNSENKLKSLTEMSFFLLAASLF